MNIDHIVIKGAREHNLKNISIKIPRNKLVVITGLSGSGKSSLAFDTIYAEGQRRYVESLSSYARQFLGLMEKPDVDFIDGLSPAISIEQKTTHRNPRSTVGTITEIYDYYRLMYARIGIPYCHICGKKISSQSLDQIVESIMLYKNGTKIQLLSPIISGKKGEHVDKLEFAKKNGFTRVRVDNEIYRLEEDILLEKNKKHTIEIIVDRLVVKDGIRPRLTDSIETAIELSGGQLLVLTDNEEKLFSTKLSCPACGISIPELAPRMFSFNSPYGACETCDGLGFIMKFAPERVILDPEKSLYNGVLAVWGKNTSYWYIEQIKSLERELDFDGKLPWKNLPKKIRNIILYGSGDQKINFTSKRTNSEFKFTRTFEGVLPNLERRYKETKSEEMKIWMEGFMANTTCTACEGKRLRKESLAVKVSNKSINQLTSLSIKESYEFFNNIALTDTQKLIAKQILKEIKMRLEFLNDVGIDYLTLDRAAGTLSGGESQRIRLATQIGSNLTGVLYVLDEPSIGLHQKDNRKLLDTLLKMRDLGNTVIVVEHDEETIREADFIVDLGPGAGRNGGYVVAKGDIKDIENNKKSLTGQYLSSFKSIELPKKRREISNYIEIKGAKENNLKNIDIKFPLKVMTAITGVSGSGKSSLVIEILYKAISSLIMRSKVTPGKFKEIKGLDNIDKVIEIDQAPIGRTPRSNPATYTGLFTYIRELFSKLPDSKIRGYKPGRFSFNVKGGRCEACRGDGLIKIEMHFLPDVYITCEVCKGKRYNHETLEIRYKGKNIHEILDMTVEEALEFFDSIPSVKKKLNTLNRVGLGYIKLGQQATTLSGGEAQRIKLATELSKRSTGKTLYILDEPTTGLHFADIKKLIEVLNTLVDKGNTIIIIEHNLDVIKTADWIIDLGPDGGVSGGEIIAQGRPEEVSKVKKSYTGHYLKKILNT